MTNQIHTLLSCCSWKHSEALIAQVAAGFLVLGQTCSQNFGPKCQHFNFLHKVMSSSDNLYCRTCVCVCLTCRRSMESGSEQALLMRYVCSMYSVILCRKLSGSLRTIGMVIFDSSCVKEEKQQMNKYAWSLEFLIILWNDFMHSYQANAFFQDTPKTYAVPG